jgi:hypothetical protein
VLAASGVTGASDTVTGLTNGTSYTFELTTKDAYGQVSGYSSPSSAVTPSLPTPTYSGFSNANWGALANGNHTESITLPTFSTGNVIVVAVDMAGVSSATDPVTPPTGWSTLYSEVDYGSGSTFGVFSRVAQAGDTTTPNFTITTEGDMGTGASAWVYSNVTGIDVYASNSGGASVAAASVTPNYAAEKILVVGSGAGPGYSPTLGLPAGLTARGTSETIGSNYFTIVSAGDYTGPAAHVASAPGTLTSNISVAVVTIAMWG